MNTDVESLRRLHVHRLLRAGGVRVDQASRVSHAREAKRHDLFLSALSFGSVEVIWKVTPSPAES